MTDREKELMKNITVLFVEDEDKVREQFLQLLRRRFDTIHVAANGIEGLEMFQEKHPELVITDIQMPRMSGLDMVKEIRLIDPQVPVIIITAFNDSSNLIRAIQLGINYFLQKPTIRDELLGVLARAVETIIQKREISERDLIIQTILSWHPYFSIVSEKDHVKHVGKSLLDFLGYSTKEEFIEAHTNVEQLFEDIQDMETGKHVNLKGSELFDYLISQTDKEHVVYLRSAKQQKTSAYLLKARYFKKNNLYLLAFLDPTRYLNQQAMDSCTALPDCDVCRFDDN